MTQADSGAASRSRERYRRVALAGAGALGSRVAIVGASVFLVPVMLGALGQERFGVWLILSSLLPWQVSADLDFGLTNSLVNGLAGESEASPRRESRRLVAASFFLLFAMAGLVAAVFGVLQELGGLPWLFGTADPAILAELPAASLAFVAGWALGLIALVPNRINHAHQESYRNDPWFVAGAIACVLVVYQGAAAAWALPALVFWRVGTPFLVGLGNLVVTLSARHPELRPSPGDLSRKTIRELLEEGRWFVLQGMLNVALAGLPNLALAAGVGAASVPALAIPARLVALVNLLSYVLLRPLWPAYAESLRRDDRAWTLRTLWYSLLTAGGGGLVFGVGIYHFGTWVCELWVGEAAGVTEAVIHGISALAPLRTLGNALHIFLVGAGQIRFIARCRALQAGILLALLVALVPGWGAEGGAWAMVLSEALGRLAPLAIQARVSARRFQEEAPRVD